MIHYNTERKTVKKLYQFCMLLYLAALFPYNYILLFIIFIY